MANRTRLENTNRKIESIDLNMVNRTLLVEVPNNIQEVKSTDMQLAIDWRIGLRDIFEAYLARGYVVEDFFSERDGERRQMRCFYVLEHKMPRSDQIEMWA